eukprot:2900831-Lingulodinium_polyedra.AAC.1
MAARLHLAEALAHEVVLQLAAEGHARTASGVPEGHAERHGHRHDHGRHHLVAAAQPLAAAATAKPPRRPRE